MIKGAVPGSKGAYVMVTDAVKKTRHKDAPYPAALVAKAVEASVAAPVVAQVTEAPASDAPAQD